MRPAWPSAPSTFVLLSWDCTLKSIKYPASHRETFPILITGSPLTSKYSLQICILNLCSSLVTKVQAPQICIQSVTQIWPWTVGWWDVFFKSSHKAGSSNPSFFFFSRSGPKIELTTDTLCFRFPCTHCPWKVREVVLSQQSPQTLIGNFQSSEGATTPAHSLMTCHQSTYPSCRFTAPLTAAAYAMFLKCLRKKKYNGVKLR